MQADRLANAQLSISTARPASSHELSARERAVIEQSAAGFTSGEIAGALGISPKTVDTYKHRIADKLGFTHRTEYLRFALRTGLVNADPGEGAAARTAVHPGR